MSKKQPIEFTKIFNGKDSNNTFCILPFVHMYIHSSEKPKICCTYEQHGLNDELNKKVDLKELWGSDYYTNVRQDMLSGKKVKECNRCYNAERNGGRSDRVVYNERYRKKIHNGLIDDLELNVDTGTQYNTPLDLDLRPGNLCNLQCRMCGPSSSTQINKEFKKMPKSFFFQSFNEDFQTTWATEENLNFILKNADIGDRIKFLGGEPTLMPEVYNILQKLLDNDMTDVTLSFTSNLTNVNKKFLDIIEKFSNVDVNISMDGVGKTLEYIRHPIKFDQIQKNIARYSAIAGIGNITNTFDIQFTLQAYNIHNILDTLRWIKETNESGNLNGKELIFSPEILYYPNFFKYDCLPKDYRDRHIQRVLLNPIVNEHFVQKHDKTIQRLEIMLEDKNEQDPEPFIRHTIYYDISRNQCMKDYLPELWSHYGSLYNKIKKEVIRDMSHSI